MDKPHSRHIGPTFTPRLRRASDDKGAAPSSLATGSPAAQEPAGPERITGTRALATVLFNSSEAFISTQGSFGLRAPLIYGFVETSMALLATELRLNGHEFKPGSHEYIWAKAVLTMIAHRAAAPMIGVVNGGLGVSTMLVRHLLNAVIDLPRRIDAWRRGDEALAEPRAYLKLPVNRDLRILTDDIATYAFDAMVFGRTLQTTVAPTSVPSGMRPGTMTGRAGLLPSAASQSSGLAIFGSVLAGHLRVWARDGHLDGKTAPPVRVVLATAGDRIRSRMHACKLAMDARLTVVLRSGTVSNAVSIPAWLLIGLSSASGSYLKDNPIAAGVTVAGLTTAAFHAFGPQWGDQKFIREVKGPDLRHMRATPDEGYASRYETYQDMQHALQKSDRAPSAPGWNRQKVFGVVCDALQAMAISGMAVVYLSQSDETGLVVERQEWQSFLTQDDGVQTPWGASLLGLGVGAATVLASQVLAQAPVPVPENIREEMRGEGVEPRAEAREATELRQLVRVFASDVLFVSLYATGVVAAPTAILAGIGAAIVNSIDFEQVGLSPTIGSLRSRLNRAIDGVTTRLHASPARVTHASSQDTDPLFSPSSGQAHSRAHVPVTSPTVQVEGPVQTLELTDMLNPNPDSPRTETPPHIAMQTDRKPDLSREQDELPILEPGTPQKKPQAGPTVIIHQTPNKYQTPNKS